VRRAFFLQPALIAFAFSAVLSACQNSSSSVPRPSGESGTPIDRLPPPSAFTSPLEEPAIYDGVIDSPGKPCTNANKPGVTAFKDYLSLNFGDIIRDPGGDLGTYACQGGFHGQGQAIDIQLDGNKSTMNALADYLTQSDGVMAKRLGLVQVIYTPGIRVSSSGDSTNYCPKQGTDYGMWRSYPDKGLDAGVWGQFCGGKTTGVWDKSHDYHLHLSFGTAGANAQTSFFKDKAGIGFTIPCTGGVAANPTAGSCGPSPTPTPTPTPSPVPTPIPTPTPTPTPTPSSCASFIEPSGPRPSYLPAPPTIAMGDQFNGSYYIQALQLLLKHNGLYPYGVDGDFGNLTRQAVVALQARAGLSQTGTVGPETWRALVNGVWLSPSTSKTYSYAGQAVQLLMTQWGYAPAIDGWYGAQSAAMVCDFQRAYGLTMDGIAGPETAFFLLR
jgi:hypothetical protein